jgi:hypothetical protein
MLSSAARIIESVCDKEEDCRDNYPENLQSTGCFEQMETAIDNLNEAMERLDDAKECIELAIGR